MPLGVLYMCAYRRAGKGKVCTVDHRLRGLTSLVDGQFHNSEKGSNFYMVSS